MFWGELGGIPAGCLNWPVVRVLGSFLVATAAEGTVDGGRTGIGLTGEREISLT